jgi:hypothetical protein
MSIAPRSKDFSIEQQSYISGVDRTYLQPSQLSAFPIGHSILPPPIKNFSTFEIVVVRLSIAFRYSCCWSLEFQYGISPSVCPEALIKPSFPLPLISRRMLPQPIKKKLKGLEIPVLPPLLLPVGVLLQRRWWPYLVIFCVIQSPLAPLKTVGPLDGHEMSNKYTYTKASPVSSFLAMTQISHSIPDNAGRSSKAQRQALMVYQCQYSPYPACSHANA